MMEALEELLSWEHCNIPEIVPIDQPQAEETVIVTTQTGLFMMGPQLDILLSTIPLPSKEDKRDLLFAFVPIKGDHIITGPAPWRLIRKKPDGALILVHEDNFPINYSSNILCHKLLVAMPTITSLALEAMRLHPEDIIIHYLNAKCTFIIPKHGSSKESIYYNKPYNFIVDGPISMQDYWHNISTLHTLEDILTVTLGMLIAQVNHVNWEE